MGYLANDELERAKPWSGPADEVAYMPKLAGLPFTKEVARGVVKSEMAPRRRAHWHLRIDMSGAPTPARNRSRCASQRPVAVLPDHVIIGSITLERLRVAHL
jgi:hypothetical protein